MTPLHHAIAMEMFDCGFWDCTEIQQRLVDRAAKDIERRERELAESPLDDEHFGQRGQS